MKYPPVVIVVEYDARTGRARKEFIDAYKARQFYASKLRANKQPKVIKG